MNGEGLAKVNTLRKLSEDELEHYGVLGMKWGVRRYQPYPKGHKGKGRFVGKRKKTKTKKESTIDTKIDTAVKKGQAKVTTDPKTGKRNVKFKDGSEWNLGAKKEVRRKAKIPQKRSGLEQEKREAKAQQQTGAARISQAGVNFAIDQALAKQVQLENITTAQSIAIKAGKSLIEKTFDSGLASAKIDKLRGKNEWKQNKSLAGKKSVAQIEKTVIPGVNPDYGKTHGTTMNCRRATIAYELRRRGIDVTARKTLNATGQTDGGMVRATTKKATNIAGGTGEGISYSIQALMSKATKGKANTPLYDYVQDQKKGSRLAKASVGDRIKSFVSKKSRGQLAQRTSDGIMKGLAKQPNNSRGELTIRWVTGGGHSVAYEIINNKPVIFDTQLGRTYKTADDLVRAGYAGTAQFTRLDNKEFNKDYVERWVKDVG